MSNPASAKVTVDILLATYNGGRYLEQQLESVLRQSHTGWRLLIRDDGSADETAAILQKYKKKYKNKIKIFAANKLKPDLKKNFSFLLQQAAAPYVMFCDQDDVWYRGKIAVTLNKIKRLEKKYGSGTPVLVHTDLEVVDAALHTVNRSFVHYQKLDYTKTALNYLLMQNNVTGCTVMINKALRKKAAPIPQGALMHDHWLALAAVLLGRIAFVNRATVNYRQHNANIIGAKRGRDFIGYFFSGSGFSFRQRIKKNISAAVLQAGALFRCYQKHLNEEQYCLLKSFLMMKQTGFFRKRYLFIKHRFFLQHPLRTLVYFLFM